MLSNTAGSASILGTGHALPARVVRNEDFPGVSPVWIEERTGIRERRATTIDERASELACQAAREALAAAQIEASALDAIICTTVTPELPLPSTACLIQARLGANNAACFDLVAACSGFLYGLWVGKHLVGVQAERRVLIVSVDLITRLVADSDVRTAVLFGDGAAAVVLSSLRQGARVIDVAVGADGSRSGLLHIPMAQPRQAVCGVHMDGPALFKIAVERLSEASNAILAANGMAIRDIDLFIPHQANRRIMEAVAQRLGVDAQRVFMNIETIGNTASASIPIALDQAVKQGRLSAGQRVLIAGFGGGLTWGAGLIQW